MTEAVREEPDFEARCYLMHAQKTRVTNYLFSVERSSDMDELNEDQRAWFTHVVTQVERLLYTYPFPKEG